MTDIHFIECSFKIHGRKWQGFVERDCDRLGLSNTVADIVSGQVEGVRKVYRADLETKSFHDVSVEIAQAVIDGVADGAPLPVGDLFDFCEEHLGCMAMAEVERSIAA